MRDRRLTPAYAAAAEHRVSWCEATVSSRRLGWVCEPQRSRDRRFWCGLDSVTTACTACTTVRERLRSSLLKRWGSQAHPSLRCCNRASR